MKKYLIFFIIILGLGVMIKSSNFKKVHGSEPVGKQQMYEHWMLPTEEVLSVKDFNRQDLRRPIKQASFSLNRSFKITESFTEKKLHPKSILD